MRREESMYGSVLVFKWLNMPVTVPLSWYVLIKNNFLVKVIPIITQNEG
jgi:uncharacterized membrane protein